MSEPNGLCPHSNYVDHHNVVFMGWGQKTFMPSPGNKSTTDSLILFSSSVLTEHGGETSADFAEKFERNTIVFTAKGSYGKVDTEEQLTKKLLLLADNKFYKESPVSLAVGGNGTMDLAQLQALGAEIGSTESRTVPEDGELVAMARALLQVK